MKNKLLKLFVLLLMLMATLTFTLACAGGNSAGTGNDVGNDSLIEIQEVYDLYVAYAEQNGITPYSYEEWLESIKGADGAKGEKGDKGDNGKDGKDGLAGRGIKDAYINGYGELVIVFTDNQSLSLGLVKGKDGADGKSAYQIWLDEGNTGTEQDFLNWLRNSSSAHEHILENWQAYNYERSVSCEKRLNYSECSQCKEIVFKLGGNNAHKMQSNYSHNDTHHWYACENCDVRKDSYGEHIVSASGFCSVCNAPLSSTEGLVFEISGNTAKITDYTGSFDKVFIAATHQGKTITSIGSSAFSSCSSLTSVTFEANSNLEEIDSSAFSNCSSLTSITIPASVTSIGSSAFSSCHSLTSITIPASVTSIGIDAFYYCTSLTQINVESGNATYKSVDGNLYSKDGTTLIQYAPGKTATSFTIPNDVTSIGDDAFSNCSSLTSVTIPASVTSIGSSAFSSCSSLSSVTFAANSNLEEIGSSAFSNCSSLTSVTIPASVTSIGSNAFSSCRSLTEIKIESGNTAYKSVDGNLYSKDGTTLIQYATGKTATSFTIPNDVTSIGSSAFSSCRSLTSITIPASVTSIGYNAFSSCRSLSSVTFAANSKLDEIGYNAFSNCSSLTSITIPASVTSIGFYAFYNCSSLSSITIPASVTSIGLSPFYNCSSLTEIKVESGNATYKSVDGNLYSKDGTTLIQYAPGKTATSFTIPNDVTSIGDYAFAYCTSLSNITIPASVTSIGSSAFNNCSSLTSITIPASVTSIGNYAFGSCSYLTIYCEISTQPSGWDSSWNYNRPVVWNCKNNDVASDGNIYAEISGIRYTLNNGTATVTTQKKDITSANIPASVTYKNNLYNVTSIGDSAFSNCSSLTSITIPASVTSIGYSAFYNCSSLTSVMVAANSNLEEIGNSAFSSCSSLTSITIPASVTSIGYSAFRDCTSLSNVTFAVNSNLEEIGNSAFNNCSSLTSIMIPASVTSIGNYALSACISLTQINVESGNTAYKSVDGNLYSKDGTTLIQYATGKTATSFTIPNGVTSIGSSAFAYCTSLSNITIPASVTSIGIEAFYYCTSLTQINVESGNATYKSVDGNLYSKDGTTLIQYAPGKTATSFTIPNGVTIIASYALSSSYLGSVTIPSGVVTIAPYATIGSNLFVIYSETTAKPSGWNVNWNISGVPVVWDCENNQVANDGYVYAEIDGIRYALKGGVATIVRQSKNLTTAIIPATVTFNNVTYSVSDIVANAFSNCDSLLSITVDENNTAFKSIDGNLYSKDGKTLIQYATGKTATIFTIPSGVTSIGDYAFYNCSSLSSMTIPASITSIGNYAFFDCDSLSYVIIPTSVTSIGSSAFYNCDSVTIYCDASVIGYLGYNWNGYRPVYFAGQWTINNGVPTPISNN